MYYFRLRPLSRVVVFFLTKNMAMVTLGFLNPNQYQLLGPVKIDLQNIFVYQMITFSCPNDFIIIEHRELEI